MKRNHALITGLILGLLPACVPSMNPLYTAKDLVFDPALVGAWAPDGSKETWRFEQLGGKRYGLTHSATMVSDGVPAMPIFLSKLSDPFRSRISLVPGELRRAIRRLPAY